MLEPRPNRTLPVIAAWLLLCTAGIWLLAEHATTAGAAGTNMPKLTVSMAQSLRWDRRQPLLVVHAHPQCPCLPSTETELRRSLSQHPDVTLRVLCFAPLDRPENWSDAAVSALAARFGPEQLVLDHDGRLSRELGATTSGHVHVYDRDGALQFSGGITAARAHAGDNASNRALRAALSGTATAEPHTQVFGCPLRSSPCCHP